MRRRVLVPSLVLMTGCALTLTSCAGADQQGSAAHRMSVWVSGTSLGEDIGTLIADNARIPKDVPNGTGAVHAACGTLLNDAEMANTNLPSPDPEVTALLDEGLRPRGHGGEPVLRRRRHATRSCWPSPSATASRPRRSTARRCTASGPSTAPRRRPPRPGNTATRASGASSDEPPDDSPTDTAAGDPSDDDELDRHRRRVLWALPTGLYLIGSRDGDEVNLMTANLVVQVCLEPKLVGVARRARVGHGRARGGRRRLHRVAPRAHRPRRGAPLRQAGARRSSVAPRGPSSRLSGQPVTEVGHERLPVLASAAGYLDCRLTSATPLGSHVLCIGEVAGVGGEPAEVLRMEDTRMHYGG